MKSPFSPRMQMIAITLGFKANRYHELVTATLEWRTTMSGSTTPLVVTLWETYGCNMEAIAEKLAAELNLPLHKQAYSSEQVEEAMAQREREGGLGALLRHLPAGFVTPDGRASVAGAMINQNYVEMAEENTAIVRSEAESGGVIQGRNGQFILRDRPNSLHVKLDGPVHARIANGAKMSGVGVDRATKRQRIEDDFRSDMSDRTYHFDPRDNGYYDLVVNGAELPVDTVVKIIKAAVEAKLG